MKASKIVLLGLVVSSLASADVCELMTREQAELSLSFLSKGAKLTQTFGLSPEMTVKNVSVIKHSGLPDEETFEIKVNGESIDPGHTNILFNEKVSLNLGRLVGCSVEDSDPNMILPTTIPNRKVK